MSFLRASLPRLAILLACCLLPMAAMAHGGDAHEMGEGGNTHHTTQLGASAAIAGDGSLWVASVTHGHVVLRASTDSGQHFSAPVQVNTKAEDIAGFGENRPEVAIGPGGQIYVIWVGNLPEKWASYIWFSRSTDGGKSFSKPILVHHDKAHITHSFATLAVNGKGQPVVAWLDARDHVAAMKKYGMKGPHAYHGLAVYYTWSPDHGKHFVSARKVMDHSCECCRIALTQGPNGVVAAFFRGVYGDNIRDHAFALLPTTSDAAPDAQRSTFSGWQVAACPEQGPGLAISSSGMLNAVWYEASHGPAIWYGHLHPGRKPIEKLKIAGAGASHADVAVHGNTVWVVWNQVSAKGYTLWLRVSKDGGQSFAVPRSLAQSKVAVYSPQLLGHDGHAWVGWNTLDGYRVIAIGAPK